MNSHVNFKTRKVSGTSHFLPIYRGALRASSPEVVYRDGVELQFDVTSVPRALIKTIGMIWPRRFSHLIENNDCMDFVCHMKRLPLRPEATFRSGSERYDMTAVQKTTTPVVLLRREPVSNALQDVHILFPARVLGEELFLHKLGNGGSLCLSRIETAMDLYGSKQAAYARLAV